MTEKYFVNLREASWNDFENLLKSGKRIFKREAANFPRLLRAITGDLNTAKANGFDPVITERLNKLILDGNQKLLSAAFVSSGAALKSFAVFLACTFPNAVRLHWRSFVVSMLLFYSVCALSTALCVHNNKWVDIILGDTKYELADMYNPDSEYYLKPRKITKDTGMFAFYVYNNISIAFRTFAGGVLLGVGAIIILIFNAVFIGAAAGDIINLGYTGTFFSFTAAHSAFELTGIVLSAQAGLILGYSFFVPRGLKRSYALKKAGKTVFPIIAGAAILIFLAAIIEAFFSSRHEIAPLWHYIAGASFWLLLIMLFCNNGQLWYLSRYRNHVLCLWQIYGQA